MATYSFIDNLVAIAGPNGAFNLGGPGVANSEGGISIVMQEDKNTMTIGAGGEGMHSLHAGKAATLTCRFLKTAPANALLAQMYAADTGDAAQHGRNTISIRDLARGDVITAQEVAFVKFADITYAKDGGEMTWAFHAIKVDFVLGSGFGVVAAEMSEIEIEGIRYRINRMNVFDQAHVARKVAPIIFSMGRGYANALAKLPNRPSEMDGPEHSNGSTDEFTEPEPATVQEVAEQNSILFDTLGPIADVLAKMSEEEVDYVLKKCLSVCQKFTGTNWAPLMRSGNLMFDDLDLATLMRLTMEVVQDNLGPSLRGLLGQASEPTEASPLNTLQ